MTQAYNHHGTFGSKHLNKESIELSMLIRFQDILACKHKEVIIYMFKMSFARYPMVDFSLFFGWEDIIQITHPHKATEIVANSFS